MKWPQLRRRVPRAPQTGRRELRRAFFESLESRHLMAVLPYGAMPDDTGEFMLGDVHVSVVLMESESGLSPNDVETRDWTAGAIAAVKSNIQQGVTWWQETLDQMPDVVDGLLNFTFDWTHADTPVATGYEPIARKSNDFAFWIYDFLGAAGFAETGNFSSDIRAYNNFQREQHDADWAFTIFVVAAEGNDQFHPNGTFDKAFAYAGGQFMVVPANRPASTYAHETGHMFWALDEYSTTGTGYQLTRGYYNTPNTNAASNPGHTHVASIMSSSSSLENAYLGHTSSPTSLEMIGWKDSDNDGIFDVLDVQFDLQGVGDYDSASGIYSFSGTSQVKTLPNKNPSGLGNDITINQIRLAQYQIDGGPWQTAAAWDDAYKVNMELSFPVPAGDHEIRIRTVDTRTGVTSVEFIGSTSTPSSQSFPSGAGGYLYNDSNNSGTWDYGELPLVDWSLELVDDQGNLIELHNTVEPDALTGVINQQVQGITLTAIGQDVQFGGEVLSQPSALYSPAESVLFTKSKALNKAVETWTDSTRQLRIDFDTPQTVVNVKALGAGGASFGRLEAYNSANELIGRYTTRQLGLGSAEWMSVARPQGDIAYVVAGGHVGTEVLLDIVNWGPKAVITTDAHGRYVLPNLPAGSYNVVVLAPPSYLPTTSNGTEAAFSLSAGQAITDLNFGFRFLGSAWQNTTNRLDTNNDGHVTPLDALVIINRLNQSQQSQLGAERPSGAMYFDVNADVHVTALDALIIINYLNTPAHAASLNQPAAGEAEAENVQPSNSVAFSSESGSPEGELPALPAATTAAEYFSRKPFHVLNSAVEDEPCMCGGCVGTAIESIVSEPLAAGVESIVTRFADVPAPLFSQFANIDSVLTDISERASNLPTLRPTLRLLSSRLQDISGVAVQVQQRLETTLQPVLNTIDKDPKVGQLLEELEESVPSQLGHALDLLRSRLLRS